MIVYHPTLIPHFEKFGLSLPVHSSRWLRPLEKLSPQCFYQKAWETVDQKDLSLAHTETYRTSLFKDPKTAIFKAYEGKEYWTLKPEKPCSLLVEKTIEHARATLTACHLALESGWGYAMGGGMHHSLSFTGQGFCLINDIVIALRILQRRRSIKKALILDVDIHKGDGTAEITHGDDSLYTVSLHGSKTWPLKGWLYPESLAPSNLDQKISHSKDYLSTLERTLEKIPTDFDLCLVVQGADPYEKDTLKGSRQINLTLEEIFKRDQMIHCWLNKHSIPQAYCMGGGYGKESWRVYAQYLAWVCAIGEKPLN